MKKFLLVDLVKLAQAQAQRVSRMARNGAGVLKEAVQPRLTFRGRQAERLPHDFFVARVSPYICMYHVAFFDRCSDLRLFEEKTGSVELCLNGHVLTFSLSEAEMRRAAAALDNKAEKECVRAQFAVIGGTRPDRNLIA